MWLSKKSEARFSVNRTKPVCMHLVRPSFLFVFWFPSFGPSFWSCCWKVFSTVLLSGVVYWGLYSVTYIKHLHFNNFLEVLPYFSFKICIWGHIRSAYNPQSFMILNTIYCRQKYKKFLYMFPVVWYKKFWFQVFTNSMLIAGCSCTCKVLFNQG